MRLITVLIICVFSIFLTLGQILSFSQANKQVLHLQPTGEQNTGPTRVMIQPIGLTSPSQQSSITTPEE